MLYIANAFSLAMLPAERACQIRVLRLSAEEARAEVEGRTFVSVMGHADIAAIASDQLGVALPVNRLSIQLTSGDELIVAQYVGPRLPEGARELPQGAAITWMAVYVE